MATLYRVWEMGGKQIWHWAYILSSEMFYGVFEARAERFSVPFLSCLESSASILE